MGTEKRKLSLEKMSFGLGAALIGGIEIVAGLYHANWLLVAVGFNTYLCAQCYMWVVK